MPIPKVFRVMKKDQDDEPTLDMTGKGLGVRGVPVNDVADVDLDSQGNVILNGRGMSVVPTWQDLP